MDIKLVRPNMLETTALGVAMVSGHTSGVWTMTGIASTVDTFLPSLNTMARLEKIDQWEQAVQASLAWGEQKEASKERTISLESSLPGTVWLFSTAAIVLLSMAAQKG